MNGKEKKNLNNAQDVRGMIGTKMKTTRHEDRVERKFKKQGYKCIRKGYPDFIFYKENEKRKRK